MPYWSLAISGLSEMNVKSFLFQVYGIGTMSIMKSNISATRMANTWFSYQPSISRSRPKLTGKYISVGAMLGIAATWLCSRLHEAWSACCR